MTARRLPALIALSLTPIAQAAPSLVKVQDLNNSNTNQFFAQPAEPNDTALLIGSTLWFTSEKGGEYDVGTLSSHDLLTGVTTIRYSMDNATGKGAKATPTRDGDLLYITTSTGGTGNRGTLATWNMSTRTFTKLWDAPSNDPTTNPGSLWGNVAVIDRGNAGKDVYFTTQNGGPGGTAYGTIQRYQTQDGSVNEVYAFQGAPDGKQPYKGFTRVGNTLYFTTFTGGLSGTGYTQGAGTLGKIEVSTRGSERVTQLAAFPSGDGSERFGVHNPFYRAADHTLYFNTLGTSTQSGALLKYDLTAGTLATLHEIQGAATTAGPFPEGKLAYGEVAEWNGWLYYTTIQGGDYGNGTINRYEIATGTHEVLFHMDSDKTVNPANPYDNVGGEIRGGFVFNGSPTAPAFFILAKKGGNYGHGTLLQLNLDPISPATPYAAAWADWLAAHPQLTGYHTLPGADSDADGRSNRDEFAFGTDPLSGANDEAITAVPLENGLDIRWTARADASVTYTVQQSPTLGAAPSPWEPVTQSASAMSEPDRPVPAGYERRHVVIPMDSARSFFRVEAAINDPHMP